MIKIASLLPMIKYDTIILYRKIKSFFQAKSRGKLRVPIFSSWPRPASVASVSAIRVRLVNERRLWKRASVSKLESKLLKRIHAKKDYCYLFCLGMWQFKWKMISMQRKGLICQRLTTTRKMQYCNFSVTYNYTLHETVISSTCPYSKGFCWTSRLSIFICHIHILAPILHIDFVV